MIRCVRLLACALLLAGPVRGQAAVEVEFEALRLHGTLAGEPTLVELDRFGPTVAGTRCRAPCPPGGRRPLSGTFAAGTLELVETGDAPARWTLARTGDGWQGTRTGADGPQPVALRPQPHAPAFPFALTLLMDAPPPRGDECAEAPTVRAIRIHRDGRLLQQLDTESIGTCGPFAPWIVDADFDGDADLLIGLRQPAGPNMSYQAWLYDARAGRFVDAPAALQDLSLPTFDAERRNVVAYWRDGAASHGVDVWRWRGRELVRVDGGSSRFFAVDSGDGVLRYHYSMPRYEDGRIVFAPRIVRGADGGLQLAEAAGADVSDSPAVLGPSLDLHVYDARGRRVERHPLRTVRGRDADGVRRRCFELPYLHLPTGRVRYRRLEDACE
ncbi:MAG: XAC2610-related protein [Pseudomonadota bacterium]